jgi:glutamyl-Q tRNA(Asp) synthetase
MSAPYVGRFAPSPTGALHQGSLVAAVASHDDARLHQGRWLVRIEDIDGPRCVPGAEAVILRQLQTLGLRPDGEVCRQSERTPLYEQALNRLIERGWAYPCACSRNDIGHALLAAGIETQRHASAVYPGTCRNGLAGRIGRAWRFNVDQALKDLGLPPCVTWFDRQLGMQSQHVAQTVGDFVLRRADGLWAYQLAVVVDDAAQGVTDVVRGMDLLDNTARQVLLQKALGLPTPRYLHVPLVLGENGEKLAKQNGAQALDLTNPTACLNQARAFLNNWGLTPI